MRSEEVFELLRARRSIRNYSDQQPTREHIEMVIEAGSWAPSNHNRQGWKFIVFLNREVICELADKVRQGVRKILNDSDRGLNDKAEELVHFAGVFDTAPVVILAMHKNSTAISRNVLANLANRQISSEALSAAMAVENILLAANGLGLGTCVMTAPLLAENVWLDLPDMPLGFVPTCVISMGYPDETPAMPRRKKMEHIIEYRE